MTITPYDIAERYIGVREIPGAADNPVIVAMFHMCGHKYIADDETAWCAAYIGNVAKLLGLSTPPAHRILAARSWLDVGEAIKLKHAKVGSDICIFWRGSETSWRGHVGFFSGLDASGSSISILGGNQSNAVSIQSYPRSRLLGVRRLTA